MNISISNIPRAMAIAMAFVLCIAPPAFAAMTITLSPSGSGVFRLQGAGMAGVSAMDIVLQYDAATLANPRIEKGNLISGAMMAVNPNTPGIVRIAIVRIAPIEGDGAILTFTFDRKNNSLGRIIGLNVKVADSKGPLQASVSFVNPKDTAAAVASGTDSPQGTTAQLPATTTPTAQTIAPPVFVAGAGMKSDEDTGQKQEEPAVVPEDMPEPAAEPVLPKAGIVSTISGSDTVAPAKKTPVVYTRKSVLERFREYTGVRTPKALIALFDPEPMIGFKQDPLVALSDGKDTVTVRFISTPERAGTADLTLTNAKLLSSKKDPHATNTWIVTLLPKANTDSATLSVPQGDMLMVFPLVVAPKVMADLDGSKKVTEADFKLFLKKRGTLKAPRYDLNKDGVRDYRDEYIFTANYLTRGGKK